MLKERSNFKHYEKEIQNIQTNIYEELQKNNKIYLP